jgi:hypothetical protein
VVDEPAEKPDTETPAEPARETAVGHQVVEPEAATPPGPQPAAAPPEPPSGTSPAAADRIAADSHDPFTDKPELFVAGAFVGAFVFGKLLKKLTGSDD